MEPTEVKHCHLCDGELIFVDKDCDPQLGQPTWQGWECTECGFEIDEFDMTEYELEDE